MTRLFFVPQLPIKMRYQEWWFSQIPENLSKYFDQIIIIGKDCIPEQKSSGGDFSNIEKAITFENDQVKQFLDYNIEDDDYLLHADISFPGFFHNVLYHKKVKNAFAFCHATSLNNYDYFASMRPSKWAIECGHSLLYKKIFVASDYHKRKIHWNNVVNLGALPNPPLKGQNSKKEYYIISVARDSIQKRTKKLEKAVEEKYGEIVNAPQFQDWDEYYEFISKSECMLITSKEECYGYQVIDAVINNCIPLAPRGFSYPELLPNEYLYSGQYDLFEKLRWTDGKGVRGLKTPKLLNQEKIDNFYQNLVMEMKNAV